MVEDMDRDKRERDDEESDQGDVFYNQAYAQPRDATGEITSWQEWANGILGLWLVLVPFLGFDGASLAWTLVITGIIVAVLGFWGALTRGLWQQWANGILGLWTIIIPLLALTGAGLAWTIAITGIAVAVLGFWSAMARR